MDAWFRYYAASLIPLHGVFALLRDAPANEFRSGIALNAAVMMAYYVLAKVHLAFPGYPGLQSEPSEYVEWS